jgi:hypothetical protein
MKHDPLQRLATLRGDQEPVGGAPGGESLLDRAAPRDELLIGAE